MMESEPINESESSELPPRLIEQLRRMHDAPIVVPAWIDRAILAEARRSYGRRRRAWMLRRWSAAAAAVAAVVLLAVGLFMRSREADRRQVAAGRTQLLQLADVNHDGRVNILDAYILARKIERHELLDPAWDINGDGIVDQKDVDLIAMLAVRADGGQAQ